MGSNVHGTAEGFYEAAYAGVVTVRDARQRLWLAWEDQDGEWWVCRPRDEEDPVSGWDGHPWAPIGPEPLDRVPLPWLVSVPEYQSRPRTPEFLSVSVVTGLLSLVHEGQRSVTPTEVALWDEGTRRDVAEWASAHHLHASDHNDVAIPPMPDVLQEQP